MELQVGVKAIIRDPRGNILLLRRAKPVNNGEIVWDIPGGRIAASEDLVGALRREIAEETGLILLGAPKPIAAQDIFTPLYHIVRITYEASVAASNVKLSEEHDAAEWVTRENMKNIDVDPYIIELLEQLYG